MVKKLAIIREIFNGDHNAAEVAARKLTRNQISALSGTLNYHRLGKTITIRITLSQFQLQLEDRSQKKR